MTKQTNIIAGTLYIISMQSRDVNQNNVDSLIDVYSVQFTRSDGGGS